MLGCSKDNVIISHNNTSFEILVYLPSCTRLSHRTCRSPSLRPRSCIRSRLRGHRSERRSGHLVIKYCHCSFLFQAAVVCASRILPNVSFLHLECGHTVSLADSRWLPTAQKNPNENYFFSVSSHKNILWASHLMACYNCLPHCSNKSHPLRRHTRNLS